MSEAREQEKVTRGPIVTLDVPTLRLLKLKARQAQNSGTFFVIRGLENIGSAIDVISDDESIERIISPGGSREMDIVACGYIRPPREVAALTNIYSQKISSVTAAGIFAATCPTEAELLSPLLKKVDEVRGKQVPRLLVGKYANSATINPFTVSVNLNNEKVGRSKFDDHVKVDEERLVALLEETPLVQLIEEEPLVQLLDDEPLVEIIDKPLVEIIDEPLVEVLSSKPIIDTNQALDPHKLVDDGIVTPGTTKVYDVQVEDMGENIFSGQVVEPNFFSMALNS